jgi:hypothetical protein
LLPWGVSKTKAVGSNLPLLRSLRAQTRGRVRDLILVSPQHHFTLEPLLLLPQEKGTVLLVPAVAAVHGHGGSGRATHRIGRGDPGWLSITLG